MLGGQPRVDGIQQRAEAFARARAHGDGGVVLRTFCY
jgi:hypothetical protein